jgi:hypothetical protein
MELISSLTWKSQNGHAVHAVHYFVCTEKHVNTVEIKKLNTPATYETTYDSTHLKTEAGYEAMVRISFRTLWQEI